MSQDSSDPRLSQISTLWTLLRQAHASGADAVTAAQQALMQRYCGAAFRYLRGALRDEDAAVELFQEFALRFIRGDFRRADAERGRFRDYVKTALLNLVNDHFRQLRDRPGPLPTDYAASAGVPAGSEDAEGAFLTSWREELVNRTWEALAQANETYHAVLLFSVQNPDLASRGLAEQLTAQRGKPFTAANVRVMLHRAREKFADLMLDEVAQSLESPSEAELVQELTILQLHKLCAPALERRGRRS